MVSKEYATDININLSTIFKDFPVVFHFSLSILHQTLSKYIEVVYGPIIA